MTQAVIVRVAWIELLQLAKVPEPHLVSHVRLTATREYLEIELVKPE